MSKTEVDLYKERDLPAVMEKVMSGDLSGLSSAERLTYYAAVCKSVGLNPATKPFQFLKTTVKDGDKWVPRVILYPTKECGEQLRTKKRIATKIVKREFLMDNTIYQITAIGEDPTGRTDEAIACVPIANLTPKDLADALMKCETKVKRRLTLSLCGLVNMADAADMVDDTIHKPFQNVPDTEEEELDPSCAEIVDPKVQDATYRAKMECLDRIKAWSHAEGMDWKPVETIINRLVAELEKIYGTMKPGMWKQLHQDENWLSRIQQRIIDQYEQVEKEIYRASQQKPEHPEVEITPDQQDVVMEWDRIFNLQPAQDAEFTEREPGTGEADE